MHRPTNLPRECISLSVFTLPTLLISLLSSISQLWVVQTADFDDGKLNGVSLERARELGHFNRALNCVP